MSGTDPIMTAQKGLEEAQRSAAMALLASAGRESLCGPETILLVDDEDAVRKLVSGVMEKYGYHVLQAATGEEALEVWKRHHSQVSVLVTDMVMPGDLNGWELAHLLLDVRPSLKVIYTSGYDAKMAAEVFDITSEIIFLQKPYLAERLAEAVRGALDSPSPATTREEK